MVHSVSKNCLKVRWALVGFLCVLSVLLGFIPFATALTPGSVRITHPQNGFYVNGRTAAAFAISGRADAGKNIHIFANGVLMGVTSADTAGFFAVNLDFSSLIEGPMTLLAFQQEVRSIPITGTYDATPPHITAAAIDDRSITLTFNESNLEHVHQEGNYRFSPSLNFKTLGGADDIARIGDAHFQLSMRSIPQDEIIHLSLSNITDAAGNVAAPMPVAINDGDHDRMADSWEMQHGLNPLVAEASFDEDGDGFSNYQEYLARSHPLGVLSAPIEIRDTIPQDDAGIINFARVPDQTAFAVLLRATDGIDLSEPDAVRFTIDDSNHQPYRRDLIHDAVRAIKLNDAPDGQATYLWVAYDRCLEPFMPTRYLPDAVIRVTVTVRDIHNTVLEPEPFEFKIESVAQKLAAGQGVPNTAEFYENEPSPGNGSDARIAVVDGKLAGAKLFYSSLEPVTPEFGNPDDVPATGREDMQPAGLAVNLLPHTVFEQPVTVFIPVSEDVDIRTVALAYYNGTRWLPAADAEGTVLPGGEGWMVAGSRINHAESRPPLIEVQVYHFSATQAVVFARFDDPVDEEKPPSHGSGANVYISCFIHSLSADASFDYAVAGFLLLVTGCLLLAAGNWRPALSKKREARGQQPAARGFESIPYWAFAFFNLLGRIRPVAVKRPPRS